MNAVLRQLRDEREARAPREASEPTTERRADLEEQAHLAQALEDSLAPAQRRRIYEEEWEQKRSVLDAQRRVLQEKDRRAQEAEEERRRELEDKSRARSRLMEQTVQHERQLLAVLADVDRLTLELMRAVSERLGRPAPPDLSVLDDYPIRWVESGDVGQCAARKAKLLAFLRSLHEGSADEARGGLQWLRRAGLALRSSAVDVGSLGRTLAEQLRLLRRPAVLRAVWRTVVSLLQLRMRASERLYAPGGRGCALAAQEFEACVSAM